MVEYVERRDAASLQFSDEFLDEFAARRIMRLMRLIDSVVCFVCFLELRFESFSDLGLRLKLLHQQVVLLVEGAEFLLECGCGRIQFGFHW